MSIRTVAIVLITALSLFTGCASYTARDGVAAIVVPDQQAAKEVVTKHSLIVAERQAEAALVQQASDQAVIDELRAHIAELDATIAHYESDDTVSRLEATIRERDAALGQQRATIEELVAERDRLKAHLQTLTIQLESANKALDEQRRIEAELEQQRIAERRQQELEAEQAAQRLRLEELKEAERREREQELRRMIPPLSSLTVPHRFIISDAIRTLDKGAILNTLLLPLSDKPWQNSDRADSVAASIADLDYPVIFVTGAMENVTALVRRLATNATLVEGGAIITAFDVVEATAHSVKVRLNAEQTVRLSLAHLVDYAVATAFLAKDGRWQEVQRQITPARLTQLKSITAEATLIEPVLLASSLYEPSHQDWSTFSPVTYRQFDYLWPLSMALDEQQFIDIYRTTHFSAATDSGNTIAFGELKERIDYLYARKVLPLSSALLPIGAETDPSNSEGVQRWAIAASVLVP